MKNYMKVRNEAVKKENKKGLKETRKKARNSWGIKLLNEKYHRKSKEMTQVDSRDLSSEPMPDDAGRCVPAVG